MNDFVPMFNIQHW